MSELFFLRSNNGQDSYLSKVANESKASLRTFDLPTSTLFNGPLIIEVNEEVLKSYLILLEDRVGPVIIAFKDKKHFNLLESLKKNLDKIYGFMDLSMDYEYNVPLLKNYLNQNFAKSELALNKLSQDLDKILEYTQTELSRVKELHDRFVKLRTENLKGGKIQIKYIAGENTGGEFFDFVEVNHEIVIIQIGTDSYIASSMMISEIELFKTQKNNLKIHLPQLIKKFLELADEYQAKVNYLITVINLKKLEIHYYQKGNSKYFYEGKLFTPTGDGVLKMKRGEKLFFISTGLMKNWIVNHQIDKLEPFLLEHKELNIKDFINELFFELIRHKNSMFLPDDAIMGCIEINENVIHEV